MFSLTNVKNEVRKLMAHPTAGYTRREAIAEVVSQFAEEAAAIQYREAMDLEEARLEGIYGRSTITRLCA